MLQIDVATFEIIVTSMVDIYFEKFPKIQDIFAHQKLQPRTVGSQIPDRHNKNEAVNILIFFRKTRSSGDRE